MYPFIDINGSRIIAVPAVHYHSLFAREVNYLCSSEETRPDGIAVELGIPAYGIDMDEFANNRNGNILISDPDISGFNLLRYVSDFEKMASGKRDPYIDGRREMVMTARLKRISCRHKKILFTGGLAHWETIKLLLNNTDIKPADFLIPEKSPEFERTIIHPSMAVAFMDSYPIITTLYENSRQHAAEKYNSRFPLVDKRQICRDILDKTYEEFMKDRHEDYAGIKSYPDSYRIPDFERLLMNLTLTHQSHSPTIHGLLQCGNSMMPAAFNKLLLSSLMDIGRPWASHKEFPGLPLITAITGNRDNNSHADLFFLTKNQREKDGGTIPFLNYAESLTVDYHNATNPAERLIRAWEWIDNPDNQKTRRSHYVWVWPPCEALLFGTAYEASRIALTRSKESVSTVFEGSLYDGIDIKSTIRSVIRGEKNIYVKNPSVKNRMFVPDGKKPEPTMFIFETDRKENRSLWSIMIAGINLSNYVKDKTVFSEIVKKYGNWFIPSIGWLYEEEVPKHLQNHVDSINVLDGYTMLGNPCINSKQAAQWLEDNDYKCCPVLKDTSMFSLVEFYREQFRTDLSYSDWKSTLIRIAIPYARERIVVIAPHDYKIPEILKGEAEKRSISIDQLPLSFFPEKQIDEIRKRIMLNSSDPDGLSYPPESEKALGQKADKYFELMPVYMQNQLKKIKY